MWSKNLPEPLSQLRVT
ncbi:hypothetical protein VULLAG_LOCUS7421 [Vulpes lagopus]